MNKLRRNLLSNTRQNLVLEACQYLDRTSSSSEKREREERQKTDQKLYFKIEGEFFIYKKIRTPLKWCQPNTPLGEVATLRSQTRP